MKNLFLVLLSTVILQFLQSCSKESQIEQWPANEGTNSTSAAASPSSNLVNTRSDGDGQITIYTGCWDEWGRTSKNCASFGLCNYDGCWAWQEPCCETSPINGNTGVISYDGYSNSYFFLIKLDNSCLLEQQAIMLQLPLYVDEDIVKNSPDAVSTYTIEAGAYTFMPTIGNYGGYKIPVVVE